MSLIYDGYQKRYIVLGTANSNMPKRFLFYLTELMKKMIDDAKAVHRPKQITFPKPEFVVLYNYCAFVNRVECNRKRGMDADHVTAWNVGGDTTLANCQMLYCTHNRGGGNA